MNEQRWIEMESRIAFQEDLIEKLNQVLAEQSERVEHLEKALQMLVKTQTPDIGPANQKPPHY